jgi:PAS domain S-box-containing protein
MSDDVLSHHEAFRIVFQNAGVGLGLAAPDARFLAVNDALCQMLDYSRDELLTKTFLEITHPEDLPKDRELAARYVAGEIQIFSVEKRYLRRGGAPIWVRVTVSAVRDPGGSERCSVAIIEDIEVRKNMEHQLAQAHAQLERRVEERTAELRAAYEQLEAETSNLRRAFDTQDNERRLVACELHDGPAQNMAAAIWGLENLARSRPPDDLQGIEQNVELLRQAIAETRRVISGLRPPILDEEGLIRALGHVAFDHTGEVDVELIHNLGDSRLQRALENALFRITQEAVTNIRRHSGAKQAQIRVHKDAEHVELQIRDWGAGFDVEQVDPSRFGLSGMRERARVLGGKATIDSRPGAGTTITVRFPLG